MGSLITVVGMFLLATLCISVMFIISAEAFLSAEYIATCNAPKATPSNANTQTTLRIGILSKVSHLRLKITAKIDNALGRFVAIEPF
jgi:hypothetical protein